MGADGVVPAVTGEVGDDRTPRRRAALLAPSQTSHDRPG